MARKILKINEKDKCQFVGIGFQALLKYWLDGD